MYCLVQGFFDEVIQSELNALNLDIELQEKIYQELIEDSWYFINVYLIFLLNCNLQFFRAFYNIEADINYLSLYADDTPFLCPICQLTRLIPSDKRILFCVRNATFTSNRIAQWTNFNINYKRYLWNMKQFALRLNLNFSQNH